MNKKIVFPGIGLRIIKSAIAVAICFFINIIRGNKGMVFYSLLAALWCIQMYRSNTLSNAIQRAIGTCVGAIFGLIYLLIYINAIGGIRHVEWLEMFLIAFFIIMVLYSTVLLNKKQAAYFSCVVFLSIVVNHIGDINPYYFVWNRFLDTMIGIAVGIVVNDFRISLHLDKKTLFISGLDDTLLNKNEMLSPFSKVELNRMIESGLKFTVSTKRTPASLLEPMRDVKLKLPVIAMDGAVLFDIKNNAYLKVYVISQETSQKIMDIIKLSKICWYANVIVDDTLLIYYENTDDKVNKSMVEKLKVSPLRNYIKRPLPDNEEVVYFMLLDKTEVITEFYDMLLENKINEDLKIITYLSDDYPGYSYIKIYNRNATKENMIKYLKQQTEMENVVTFGTIPGHYDVLIKDDANEVVKTVRKMYEPIFRHNKNNVL